MLQRVSHPTDFTAIAKRGSGFPHGETDFTVARIARAIWPHKTAEHWASAVGCDVRTAKYWLAGRTLSADAKLAIVKQILS